MPSTRLFLFMANSPRLGEISPNASLPDGVVGRASIIDTRQAPQRADSYLNALIAASKIPGIQYLVATATGVEFEHSSGWADIRSKLHVEAATTMMAYSMSKTITAVAALQLVEAGRVGLDNPVERYVDSQPYGPAVTVRQLISHTISDWVHNIDAAQGDVVISHGGSQRVRLVLVPPTERAPILQEFVRIASSGRKHFPLPVGAPLADFAAVATQYPVYRIDSAAK